MGRPILPGTAMLDSCLSAPSTLLTGQPSCLQASRVLSHSMSCNVDIARHEEGTVDRECQAHWHAGDSLKPGLALENSAISAPLILPRVPSTGHLCLRCRAHLDGRASMKSQSGRQDLSS